MQNQKETKHVVLLVPPRSELMDVSGPLAVFAEAIDKYEQVAHLVNFSYAIHVVSATEVMLINTSSGLPILAEGSYLTIDYPIDTLIITGLPQPPESMVDAKVLHWIYEQSKRVRRVCSICSGAFILAEAGVLAGKKATTHWQLCKALASTYPEVEVQEAPIFVKDGHVYTSAGITASMDLALALIEEDLGRSYALFIARWMVLFLKRPGNQSQYSTVLSSQDSDYEPIKKSAEWILLHLKDDLSVAKIAEQALMSPRNYARVFLRELHTTPAKYIEKLRIETACRYLVETQLSIDEIATQCGLRTQENLRHIFLKVLETTPSLYRKSFRSAFL